LTLILAGENEKSEKSAVNRIAAPPRAASHPSALYMLTPDEWRWSETAAAARS